jgi:hypothetical protein
MLIFGRWPGLPDPAILARREPPNSIGFRVASLGVVTLGVVTSGVVTSGVVTSGVITLGVVTRAAAMAVAPLSQVDDAIRAGRFVRLHRGVYARPPVTSASR